MTSSYDLRNQCRHKCSNVLERMWYLLRNTMQSGGSFTTDIAIVTRRNCVVPRYTSCTGWVYLELRKISIIFPRKRRSRLLCRDILFAFTRRVHRLIVVYRSSSHCTGATASDGDSLPHHNYRSRCSWHYISAARQRYKSFMRTRSSQNNYIDLFFIII